MSTARRVARNTGILFAGRIATKTISFFILLYIARYLGPADFGIFNFVFAFIYFFGFIPDLGIHNILVREVAREPKLAGKIIGNATIIKLLLSAIAFLLAFLIINLMNYPDNTKSAVYIASLGLLITTLSAFGVVYEVNLRMEYSVLFGVTSRIFFLAFILLAIQHNLTFIYFVFASVAADLVHNILMVIYSRRFVKPKFDIDYGLIKKILHEALPVALGSVFIMIYFRIDILMLSFFKNDIDVGFYSAAYRLTEAFIFIPSIVMISVFPLMSKYFKNSHELFLLTYTKSFKYLFASGVIFAVIITFLADIIISHIYGPEYHGSIEALQILAWATAIMFVNNLLSFTYISTGNQKLIAKISSIGAFMNIILNFFLIPSFSYTGAAFATVVTEAFAMIVGIYWAHKNILNKNLIRDLVDPSAGIFIIVFSVLVLKSYVNIIALCIVSLLFYFTFLWMSGWIDEDDKMRLIKLIKKNS